MAYGTGQSKARRSSEEDLETACTVLHILFFFFSSRRRHTRLTCDWSSDVCSSDLRSVIGSWAETGMGGPHEGLYSRATASSAKREKVLPRCRTSCPIHNVMLSEDVRPSRNTPAHLFSSQPMKGVSTEGKVTVRRV